MFCTRVLFHVHSNASFDGIMPVKLILKYCQRNQIEVLIISDHENMHNIARAKTIGDEIGVTVIPAIEYTTNAGDIIALFAQEVCSSKNCVSVLKSIRNAKGLSVLPHPMKAHNLEEIPFELIDLVETYNARCTSVQNMNAEKLCQKYNKPKIVGTDAHLPWELGLALNIFLTPDPFSSDNNWLKRMFCRTERHFECNGLSPLFNIHFSQLIKGVKQKNYKVIYNTIQGSVATLLRGQVLPR